jgi:hypothetical protein
MLDINQVIYYLNTKHIFWSLPIGAPGKVIPGHTRILRPYYVFI